MLMPGTVFCHSCGHSFSESCYYNNTLDRWVQLQRTLMGEYIVKPYFPRGGSDDHSFDYSLRNPKKPFTNSGKSSFFCEVHEKGQAPHRYLFSRACPHCAEQHDQEDPAQRKAVRRLENYLGELPSYVIGLMGSKSIGKSCWLHSLSVAKNVALMNKVIKKPYGYQVETLKPSVCHVPGTLKGAFGETTVLYITKKGKKIAAILMVDLAGEYFAPENKEAFINSPIYTAFSGDGDGFTGVDGVIFMDAPNSEADLAISTYNQLSDLDILSSRAVCYVLSKMDTTFNQPPCVDLANANIKVPLYTKSTFPCDDVGTYNRDDLVKRIRLETHIAKQHRDLAKLILNNNKDSAGFLIKSCAPTKNVPKEWDQTKEYQDFSSSINVVEPLIWMLNKLEILPLCERK